MRLCNLLDSLQRLNKQLRETSVKDGEVIDFMASSARISKIPFTYPDVCEAPLVLCVDDNAAILELLEDVLTSCGVRAICTDDCNLALRLAAAEPVDVVVLDYHMPQMDGITLARLIHDQKAGLQVILFSGAPLPLEALATASRVVHKSEGALHLAEAILQSVRPRL